MNMKIIVNDQEIPEVESITLSESLEFMPEFDDNDQLIEYKRGKKVIVGSIVATRYSVDVFEAYKDKPFDLNIISEDQDIKSMTTLYGVEITQTTDGISLQDIGSSIGYSFVAKSKTPWKAV